MALFSVNNTGITYSGNLNDSKPGKKGGVAILKALETSKIKELSLNRADNYNISEFTNLLGHMYSNIVNLKEVWLSSTVDLIKYIRDLHKSPGLPARIPLKIFP